MNIHEGASLFTRALLCAASFALIGFAQTPPEVRKLSFSYRTDSPNLNNEVLAAVNEAALIYSDVHCASDNSCSVPLSMDGNVRVDLDRVATIVSFSDIQRVSRATGATVVIADRILPSACEDKKEPTLGPGRIYGCAGGPGGLWIAIDRDPKTMGLTLAHEFGHACGLPHRNNECALMRPVYSADNRALDPWECNQLHNPSTNPPRRRAVRRVPVPPKTRTKS